MFLTEYFDWTWCWLNIKEKEIHFFHKNNPEYLATEFLKIFNTFFRINAKTKSIHHFASIWNNNRDDKLDCGSKDIQHSFQIVKFHNPAKKNQLVLFWAVLESFIHRHYVRTSSFCEGYLIKFSYWCVSSQT